MDDDRTGIAVGHADLDRRTVTRRADEHGEAVVRLENPDGVPHGVTHVVVADTMLARAGRDERHTPNKLPCRARGYKLPCHSRRTASGGLLRWLARVQVLKQVVPGYAGTGRRCQSCTRDGTARPRSPGTPRWTRRSGMRAGGGYRYSICYSFGVAEAEWNIYQTDEVAAWM